MKKTGVLICVFACIMGLVGCRRYSSDKTYTGITAYALNSQVAENESVVAKIVGRQIILEGKLGQNLGNVSVDFAPDEVILGEDSFFVFSKAESFEDEGKVARFNYDFAKMQEMKLKGLTTLSCKDGFLFMGIQVGENKVPYFLNGISANYYIEEKKFGQTIKKITKSISKELQIPFFHDTGFYCTEPDIGNYPGTMTYTFDLEEKEKFYSSQAQKDYELVLSVLQENMGKVLRVWEYQTGNYIYGVCNGYSNVDKSQFLLAQEDLMSSFSFVIDAETDEITVLAKSNNELFIFTNETFVIYQKEDEIIKENYTTHECTCLKKIQNPYKVLLALQGNFLEVRGEDQVLGELVRWNT